jgi:multidrug transporter EmrE-like cation transporter
MLALVLSTVFSAAFGLLIRTAQGMGANLVAVGAANYLTATVVNAALFLLGRGLPPRGTTVVIAVAGGITYATAFFAVYLLTRSHGASVTGAVMRLSSVIPVAASLPLLSFRGSTDASAGNAAPAGPRRGGWLVPGLFAINGLCLLAPRTWQETGITGRDSSFLVVLFAAAALTAWTVWAFQRRGIRWLDVACGVAVGASNAVSNLFTVKALHALPGTVVYPFYSAIGLVIVVAVSRVAWRERFGRLGTAGIAIACAAIVLVNLRPR